MELATLKRPINPTLIDYLADLLEMAERGEITGIAVLAYSKASGAAYRTVGITDRYLAMGLLSHQLYKLQSDDS